MNGLTMLLAGGAVASIAVWLFGDKLARLVGIVLVLDGVGGIAVHGNFENPRFAWEAGIGLALWMVGHWLFAAKFGMWRSRMGRVAWRAPVLRVLRPI